MSDKPNAPYGVDMLRAAISIAERHPEQNQQRIKELRAKIAARLAVAAKS